MFSVVARIKRFYFRRFLFATTPSLITFHVVRAGEPSFANLFEGSGFSSSSFILTHEFQGADEVRLLIVHVTRDVPWVELVRD